MRVAASTWTGRWRKRARRWRRWASAAYRAPPSPERPQLVTSPGDDATGLRRPPPPFLAHTAGRYLSLKTIRHGEDEMTTRRDFIGGMTGAMAGVAFVGCELLPATHAHAQPAPRRREVVVNGRR